MSKLMSVLGIILLAIGVALAVVGIVNPAQTQILGVSMDTAAIMGVGGVLSLGLGALIGAVEHMNHSKPHLMAEEVVEVIEASEPEVKVVAKPDLKNVFVPRAPEPLPVPELVPAAVPELVDVPVEQPSRIRFPGFGRRIAATTAVATGAVAATTEAVIAPVANVTPSVQETIEALEKAKSDINNALGGVATIAEPPPAIVETIEEVEEIDEPEAEEEVAAEGELYVLEEKTIRGRPARVLSDNTVEAETDEGWMRFENLEHLNEYLDAEGENA